MILSLNKKSIRRLKFSVLNVTNNLFPSFISVLISLLTIRIAGVELWGAYSKILLLVTIAAQLLSWGSKEFLIKEFSRMPSLMQQKWSATFAARNILLIPSFIILFPFINSVTLWLLACSILLFRYIGNSYEAIILYDKKFVIRIISEGAGSLLICSFILFFKADISLTGFLTATVAAELIKVIILLLFFKNKYRIQRQVPSLQPLKEAFPFFLLTFSGLLLSRFDQFIVAQTLPSKSFGFYQVLMNFLLMFQALSNFVLQPLLKTLYRSKPATTSKIASSLFINGIFLTALCMIVLKLVLIIFYDFEIEIKLLLAGWIFVLAPFYYLPYAYHFYKLGKTHYIIIANACGILLTLGLVLLLSRHSKDILFLMLGIAATVQWLIAVTYIILFRVKTNSIDTMGGNDKQTILSSTKF